MKTCNQLTNSVATLAVGAFAALGLTACLSLTSCKTAETAQSSSNEVKSGDAAGKSDVAKAGKPLANEELTRMIYDRARQEIEGSTTSDAAEVKSLLGQEGFRFLVLDMVGNGKPVKDLAAADELRVHVEGSYMRTIDAYENPDGPEDSCLAFTAAAGVRRTGETWEIPADKGGFSILGETNTACL